MKINSHILFNGRCEEAFKFYEKSLGGKIQFILPYGESPSATQVPANWQQKIMHATISLGDQTLMGCDAPPDHYDQPKGFSVALHTSDPAEAERAFNQLSQNGAVKMPLQETFWATRFGMLVDQFGIPWMVNCEKAA